MHDHPNTIHVHLNETAALHDLNYSMSWVPVLGPSASIIVQVIVNTWPLRSTWSTEVLAAHCGLSVTSFWRAFGRLQRFGVAELAGTDTLVVRRYMPTPAHQGMLDRLEVTA